MVQLASLIYFPIKACRGCEVDSAQVDRMGLQHDRRMMVVTCEGKFLTQREYPRLALVTPELSDGRLRLSAPGHDSIQLVTNTSGTPWPVDIWKSKGVHAIDQGEEAAEWFSDWLDAPVRLVHIAEGYMRRINEKYALSPDDHTGFADGYPILLASEESLKDLNSRLEAPVPMDRFRPNIVVRGAEPFAEDCWKRIRIGQVELAVVKPCARCVVTTIDKETLEQGHEPLRTLGKYRKHELGAIFGQNVIPLNEGRIRLGMSVEVTG
ncbi:MAG TPA: MOSC domain-containing protein [Anaerolineales bacterium]|nr:MOSC domain-containing protein [Anaerolineales bacterium]